MHIYFRRTLLILLPLLVIVGGIIAYAMVSSGYFADAAIFNTDRGAIRGYDPVAYFEDGVATPGSEEIVEQHEAVVWRFVSEENRRLFRSDPAKYMPQYGGYCAYAMSEGYTAYSDPTAWAVVEGRLYLNYSAEVKAEWAVDRDARVARADTNWRHRRVEAARNE